MNGARCLEGDKIIHSVGHSDKAEVTNGSFPTCGRAKRWLFVESKGMLGPIKTV